MKYRKALSRRTLLRGAGSIMIGLPFLDAMHATSVYAAAPEPAFRAFNLFFGLGFPTPLQEEGLAGPMSGLSAVADKLVIVRGVDQVRADENGSNAHYDGATASFNATMPDGEAKSGGPTIDQVLRREMYPGGQPEGVIQTLLAGTYFRRSRLGRYVHCWNEEGTPASLPEESPEDLFVRIFGEDPGMGGGPDGLSDRRLRYKQSILDSVVDQYQFYKSDASNLGAASRARIADHLDLVREYEMRVFGDLAANCDSPEAPPSSELPHGDAADPDGEGIDITVDELTGEWRLIADLFALAIKCDRVRFGGLTFQAAGERIRLTGDYVHEGELVHTFDDAARHGASGSGGCSHEWWHKFNPSNANVEQRAHIHLMMAELSYFMQQLDGPDAIEANGLSILENSLVSISTESGDGRHNDVQRELSGIFHAFSGANERLATGQIVDAGAEGLDVYNTILQDGYGLDTKLGPAERAVQRVDAIL